MHYTMKKTYLVPSTEAVTVIVDSILMNSLNDVGGQDVTMASESDFDSFFGA